MAPTERRRVTDAVVADKLDEIEAALVALRRLLGHRPRMEEQQRELNDLATRVRTLRLTCEARVDSTSKIVDASPTHASRLESSLSPNLVGLRRNLFDASHNAVVDWSAFRWHRSRSGEITADLPNSSQAFCVSTWGTAASERGDMVRAVISGQLQDEALTEAFAGFIPSRDRFVLEHVLPDEVLGEGGRGNPTNLDVLWDFAGLVVVVESKLTEDFGSCGQAKDGYCNGHVGPGSDLKTGTDARCRLEVADGPRRPRRYWQVLERLGDGKRLPAAGSPCPMARGGYQVARVVAAAAELGRRSGRDWRAVFAYPAMLLRDTRETLDAVTQMLSAENRRRVLELDYSALAPDLLACADDTAQGLGSHLWQRLAACRHHDAWSVLTRVPTARPLRTGTKIHFPQYAASFERGMTFRGAAYGSYCAHATGYFHPATARLCFVVASKAGVRIRAEGVEPSGAQELARIASELARAGFDIVEHPHALRDAWTMMARGAYPGVLDESYAAVEAIGYRLLWEEERATT
jgi:hypothetical protein